MSRLQDVILRGTRATQPAATAVSAGTLYFVTDEDVTERSSGSAWESYSAAGGATDVITVDFKGADETRGNTASVVADDSTMRIALGVGTHYVKVFALTGQTTNNGDFRWSLQFSGTATSVQLMRSIINNGTQSTAHVTSLSNGSANDISANAVGVIMYEGQIVVSVSGNLELKWTGDDTAVNTTLRASSYMAYKTM
jgi:type 1 fimbria pilin